MWQNFHPADFSLISGEQLKVIWSQVGTVCVSGGGGARGGRGQNLDTLLLYEGHSDLGFVGFAQLWDPFFVFFP